jgi:plastocyanin
MMRKWMFAVAALVAVAGPGTGAVWMDSQPAKAAETKVTVDDSVYAPAEITVPVGSTVIWQNTAQNAPHSAKAKDGSFDTGYIMPGAEGRATMSKAGKFEYYCEPHPYKTAIVNVQEQAPRLGRPAHRR